MTLPIRCIQQATADFYEVKLSDILGPSRTPEFSHPRQLAMSMALKEGYSTSQVGRAFKRDHTTVMHAKARVQERMNNALSLAQISINAAAELHHERATREANTWVFRTGRNTPKFTSTQEAHT